MNNENFEPDTEYTVNVRSIPNQQQFQGQWSEWASEVHWRTEAIQQGLVKTLGTLPETFEPNVPCPLSCRIYNEHNILCHLMWAGSSAANSVLHSNCKVSLDDLIFSDNIYCVR